MHLRRAAAFVLGAWIIGSLFMAYIDAEGSESAEALLARPQPEINKMVQTLGSEGAARLLRYHAAEQQRRYLRTWGITQIAIGLGLIALLVYATSVNRLAIGLAGAMLVMAVFASFVLAPEIVFLGRGLDFASGWSANRARYLALRGTFVAMEAVKLALGCCLAAYLFVYKTPRLHRRLEHESTAIAAESQRNLA